MKRGQHHTAETIEIMRSRNLAFWTREKRAEQAERTRRRMSRPEVRQRIRDGMRRVSAEVDAT